MTSQSRDRNHDVVTVGNALVDVISHESDDFLQEHRLVKGAMTLVDAPRAAALYAAMGPAVEISGGSAANTAVGVASLGGRAGFIGRVSDDQLGAVFTHDIRSTGVTFNADPVSAETPTGNCLVLVTPDAQRTLNTFLGSASDLGPGDVDLDLVAGACEVYMEGYLWDRPAAKDALRLAAAHANASGARASITLSDSFCVERHRESFLEIIHDAMGLVFANHHELLALYETDDLDHGMDQLAAAVELAVVTLGPEGSVILNGADRVRVPRVEVDRRVDTTGAGDLYAAGFLLGLARDYDLPLCGTLGSAAAAEAISHTGARPEIRLETLIEQYVSG